MATAVDSPPDSGELSGIDPRQFADAVEFAEGYHQPGSRPQRNNNPGDLKRWAGYPTDAGGYTVFPSYEAGRRALEQQAAKVLSGSDPLYRGARTVGEVAQVWSPEGAADWAKNVQAKLGRAGSADSYSDLPPGAKVVSSGASPVLAASYSDLPAGARVVGAPGQPPRAESYKRGSQDPAFIRDYGAWVKQEGAPAQERQTESDVRTQEGRKNFAARHPIATGAAIGAAQGAGGPAETSAAAEIGEAVKNIAEIPGNAVLGAADYLLPAAAYRRAIGEEPPSAGAIRTANARLARPGFGSKAAGAAEEAALGVPIIGPAVAGAIEKIPAGIAQRDPELVAEGLANLATQAALMRTGATEEGRAAVKGAVEKVGGPVERAGRAGLAKAQAATVPAADSSLFRAVRPTNARSGAMADLRVAGPELQRWAQQNGAEIRNLEDLRNAVPQAKRAVWREYEQLRGPYAGATIDGNEIADAMVGAIDKRTRQANPGLAARIERQAGKYRRPLALDEAEDFLQSANNDLASYYAKNKVGRSAAERDPAVGYTVAEADALRNALYRRLDDLTGADARSIKQRYGALTSLQDMVERRRNVALRNAPVGTMESLGRLAGIGRTMYGALHLSPADVAAGVGQIALGKRLSQLSNTDWNVENAFHGPRAFAPAVRRAIRPVVIPPERGLAAGAIEMPEGEISAVRGAPAQAVSIRNPRTGRFGRAYTSEARPAVMGETAEGPILESRAPIGPARMAAAGSGRGTAPLVTTEQARAAIQTLRDPAASAAEKMRARDLLVSDPTALRVIRQAIAERGAIERRSQ